MQKHLVTFEYHLKPNKMKTRFLITTLIILAVVVSNNLVNLSSPTFNDYLKILAFVMICISAYDTLNFLGEKFSFFKKESNHA